MQFHQLPLDSLAVFDRLFLRKDLNFPDMFSYYHELVSRKVHTLFLQFIALAYDHVLYTAIS